MTQEKKDFLIGEREKKKASIAKTSKTDVKVDLLELPQVTISNSVRMQEPATEAQLNWVANLGYDIVNNTYTKHQCSEIISNQSASPKQIALLKYHKYDVSNGVTLAEFRKAYADIEKRENQKVIDAVKRTLPAQDGPYF